MTEIKIEPLNNEVNKPVFGNEIFQLFKALGDFKIVTTAPTAVPEKFTEDIQVYTDSLSAPTVWRLYIYVRTNSPSWRYVALT